MEGDEMEMTREELQKFIWDSVNRRLLQTPEVMSKQSQLLHLWEGKEKLYTDLYKLFESVSQCEVGVRQLYAKIGWEYKDLNTEDCNGSASNCGADATDVGCASASSGFTATCLKREQEEIKKPGLRKELIVLLEQLPKNLKPRRSTCLKAPQVFSDDECSGADSEYQPSLPSSDSDSDFSISSDQHKKKKIRKDEKFSKKKPAQQATSQEETTVKTATTVPPAGINNTNITNGLTKQLAVTDEEIHVGMQVLARKKKMRWEKGIVADIVEKENGTKKYKVTFEDKGKVLVSGHHIAYNTVPKLLHLSVGHRVLSNLEDTFFSPGILAEAPSRKNRMRFLIFFDDHSVRYVALPTIRVICKPLPNPLDDIRDEEHKRYMTEYVERLPYTPQTTYKIEQSVKVKRNGAMEACTVLEIDGSLMKVAFTKDDHKDWIYRGAMPFLNAKEKK